MQCGKCHIHWSSLALVSAHAAPRSRPRAARQTGARSASGLPSAATPLASQVPIRCNFPVPAAFASSLTQKYRSGLAMSSNSSIRMIHCPACQVTAPREESELARPSGRICLVCGSPLIAAAVAPVQGWTMPDDPLRIGVRSPMAPATRCRGDLAQMSPRRDGLLLVGSGL